MFHLFQIFREEKPCESEHIVSEWSLTILSSPVDSIAKMNVGERREGQETTIYTFGGLRVSGPQGEVSRFRTRQTASLLAYLLLHRGAQIPRDGLIEMLWPESTQERGRHNLSVALSALRTTLGEASSLLSASHTSVSLAAETCSDLREFESLRRRSDTASLQRLLEIYKGSFLAGLYDSWIIPHQAALEAEFTSACKQLSEAFLSAGDQNAAREVLVLWRQHVQHDDQQLRVETAIAASQRGTQLPARSLEKFLGRQTEKQSIADLLRMGRRLITVLGPGGVGKTTLCLEVIRELALERTCYVVRLAQVDHGSGIIDEIGRTMGLSALTGLKKGKQIARAFGEETLLLLDNLEHLLPEAAKEIDELLDSSEGLQLLITSRRATRVIGEQCFALQPFPVPGETASLERALTFPSVQLFLSRASLADPTFEATPETIVGIAQVCSRLDGLPLAIELAASNIAVFSPEYMGDRIHAMSEFLGNRPANQLSPHESFSAAVQWSLDLLKAPELLLLKRLSLVPGSFHMSLVRAMGGTDRSAAELCGQSLLQAVSEGSTRSYRVLEPVREMLQACTSEEELAAAESLLIDHARAQTGELRMALLGPDQAQALASIGPQLNRFEKVLALLASRGRHEHALAMVSDLRRFWLMSGSHELGLRRLEELLPHCPDGVVKAEGLYTAGRLARKGDKFLKAGEYFDQGLALSDASETEAGCLYGKALMLHIFGRDDEALPLAERSLEIFRRLRDSEGILVSAKCCGYIHLARRDLDIGLRYHNEALLAARLANDAWGELNALQALSGLTEDRDSFELRRVSICAKNGFKLGLAQALLERGYGRFKADKHEEGLSYLQESYDTFRMVGHTIGMIQALNAQAEVRASQGEMPEAITLLEEAVQLTRERPESPNGWRSGLQLGWLLLKTSPGEAGALAESVLREVPKQSGTRLMLAALEAEVLRACATADRETIANSLSRLREEAKRLNRQQEWIHVEAMASQYG